MTRLMRGKFTKFAWMLSLIAIAFVGVSGVNGLAGETGSALKQLTETALPSCAMSRPAHAATRFDREDGKFSVDQLKIAHGSWHPCAKDPNACGAGHSCCSGHCVYGSCTN